MEAPVGSTLLRLFKAAICLLSVLAVAGQSLEVSGTITQWWIYVALLASGNFGRPEVCAVHPPSSSPITLHLPTPDVAPVHARSRTYNGPASYTHPRAPAVSGVSPTRPHASAGGRAANPRWRRSRKGGKGLK